MTHDGTYNGWKNVETWRVQLHLANDEWTAERMLNHARWRIGSPEHDCNIFDDGDILSAGDTTPAEYVRDFVVQRTRDGFELTDEPWATLKADTVAAALERVDWESIANHWLAAARDEMTTHGVQP